MDISLPAATPWGPGRLDAFGMIFNRIAARDLEIRDNFKVADAPVRYPFLWNASRQDRTQWNGGVRNGLYIVETELARPAPRVIEFHGRGSAGSVRISARYLVLVGSQKLSG
jgi:hypothetical protein